jgi:ERCC4-type nuclease
MTEVLSATHKRNHTITNDEQLLASIYSESAVSFLYNDKSYRNDNNDKSRIYELDLANGLIELLVENNFTLKSLLNTSSSELSKILGIDEEVATLIYKAAKSKNPPE